MSMVSMDTEWAVFPICPYCGNGDQDCWNNLGDKNDGDTWSSNCGNCGKDYSVTMSVSVHFSTRKER